jgi:hypothetical protein
MSTAAGKDYVAIARQRLLDEDRSKFEGRVRAAARRLEEADRRESTTDFPTGPAEMRQRFGELQIRYAALLENQRASRANPALTLAAAEEDELRLLEQRLHEMAKRIRQLDRAAA